MVTVTVNKIQDPQSREQSQITASQPWTSTEQDCSVISLEEFQKEAVLERKGVQESWLIFTDLLLQAQEWSLPVFKESSKGVRRPAWTNKKILTEFKCKRECTRITGMIQVIQKKTKTLSEHAVIGVRNAKAHAKAKTHFDFHLVQDMKGN